jgi:hypothetical protein
MALRLQIDGLGTVEVGDEFGRMTPEQQNAFVGHIFEQSSKGVKSALPSAAETPKPDKYRQAAMGDAASARKAGIDPSGGYMDRILSGMTFGASDEILAGLGTIPQMIKRGTLSPTEGYNYAKAAENERMDSARKSTGLLGTAAELAGGVLTGGNAAKAGLTLLKQGQALPARVGAMAGEGGIYGGVTGFNEGEGADRLSGAAGGAVAGGLLGAAIPSVGAAVKTAASPVVSNIMARMDPEAAAAARVARAVGESGKTVDNLGYELSNASAAGQGEFTLADALGNPGQRLLSTVARAPGEGRSKVVEFMNARQAGQADRVGGIIDEALGADQTGRQAMAAKTAEARNASRPLYKAANEYPIQWNDKIEQIVNDPVGKSALNKGIEIQRLEALAGDPSFNPRDFSIAGFNEAAAAPDVLAAGPNMRSLDAVKKGLDQILEGYRDPTTGRLALDEYGRAVDQVRRTLIEQLDQANPIYKQARAAYAGPASEREAIGLGQQAASRGRAADNIDLFNTMNDPRRQAFRVGYADTLNTGIERGAEGVNATRRLTSGKYRDELPAFSLDQGPLRPGEAPEMQKRLAREQTMFETRRQATGGSQTAENLADQAENQVDTRVFASLLKGDVVGAGKAAFMGAGNVLGGNTPAVRTSLAEMLLSREPQAVKGLLSRLEEEQAKKLSKELRRTNIGRGLLTGASEYAGQRTAR